MRNNNLNNYIDWEGVEGVLTAIACVLLFGLAALIFAPVWMSVTSLFGMNFSTNDVGFAIAGGGLFIGFGGFIFFLTVADNAESKVDNALYTITSLAWIAATFILLFSEMLPINIVSLIVISVIEIAITAAFIIKMMF